VLQQKPPVLQPVLDLPEGRAPDVPFSARLYKGDSRVVLRGDIERPDLIVTDPPYGKNEGRSLKFGEMGNDKDPKLKVVYKVMELAIRLLKPGGQIYCFSSRVRPMDLKRAGGDLIEVIGALAWIKSESNQGKASVPFLSTWDYVAWGRRLPDYGSAEDIEELRNMEELRAVEDLHLAMHEFDQDEESLVFDCDPEEELREFEELQAQRREPGELLDYRRALARRGETEPEESKQLLYRDWLREVEKRIPALEPIDFATIGKAKPAVTRLLSERRADRVMRPSHLDYQKRDRVNHATPKPVALLKELIRVSSEPGDLVLDPFAGSGSTGVAAIRVGRRFLGIEKCNDDPQWYIRTAKERLTAAECGPIEEVLAEDVRHFLDSEGLEPSAGHLTSKEIDAFKKKVAAADRDALPAIVRSMGSLIKARNSEASLGVDPDGDPDPGLAEWLDSSPVPLTRRRKRKQRRRKG